MRSFLAVLAGFFTVPIISISADHAYHAINPAYTEHVIMGSGMALIVMAYGAFAVLIGGYVTGMIARKKYVMHGVILGCIGLLIAIPAHILMWRQGPVWYHIADLLLVVPVCAWGAYLAGKRQERRALSAA